MFVLEFNTMLIKSQHSICKHAASYLANHFEV